MFELMLCFSSLATTPGCPTDSFSLLLYLYQLIFLPATSRAAVGILICVVCCCTLNFFQPHRNRLVLFVSQMSFLMSTFKYVFAVFLRLNELNDEDRQAMGWVLVLLDVVFLVASAVAFVLVIVLLHVEFLSAAPQPIGAVCVADVVFTVDV
jgi:Mn2+/Fe2+ NRAMP family transporter